MNVVKSQGRRSRSFSPYVTGQKYNANDKFPDTKDFKFDSVPVTLCWNCSYKLNAPSDDIVLCKRCAKWDHNYHVDPVGYHESEYHGNCIFCDKLKALKKNRKEKVVPIPSMPYVTVEDPENEDDFPGGDPEKWKYYWNYLRNGHNIKTGDVVYRFRPGSEEKCDLWWIMYLFTDKDNEPWINAVNLRLPQDIVRDKQQLFYAREVFPCIGNKDYNDFAWFRLKDAVGRAVAIPRKLYFVGRPRGVDESDVYVMNKLWDSTCEEQGNTIDWGNNFSFFPFNEESYSWKLFKPSVKVFKKNLIIEDNSYKVYYPKVNGDRFS